MADKLIAVVDGATRVRLADMGDGTHAEVIAAQSSLASTTGDQLVGVIDGSTKIRLRDMGDGTHAEVKYGV